MVNLNLSSLTNNAQILSIVTNQANQNNSVSQINPDLDFKQLISELLDKNQSDEKINIIKELLSNEKLYTALYQAIAIFNITGEINNVPVKTEDELAANNIIKEIIISNNLNQNETGLLLKSIKLAAVEIVSGAGTQITDNGTKTEAVASNLSGNNLYNSAQQKVNSQPVNPAMDISTKQKPEIDIPLRQASIQQNTDYNFIKKPNIPEPEIANVIQNNNSNIENKISFIKVDNKIVINNSQKIIPGQAIVPEKKNEAQQINMLNTANEVNITEPKIALNNVNGVVAGKTENVDLKLTNNILYNIENIVKDLKGTIDKFLTENNHILLKSEPAVDDNIKIINSRINEIIDNLNQIKNLSVNTNLNLQQETVKEGINSIVDKLINIIIVMHKVLAQPQYATADENLNNVNVASNNADTKNLNNEIINIVDLSSNQKSGDEFISNQEQKESKFFSEIKDSMMKIFTLLKELNGEMQVFKKIEYVYQPNTTKTSTITKEGVLLINLSPIEKANFDLKQTSLQIKNADIPYMNNKADSNFNSKINNVFDDVNNDTRVEKPQVIYNLNSNKIKNTNLEQNINTRQLNLDVPVKEDKNEIAWLLNKVNTDFIKDKELIKIDKNNLFTNINEMVQKAKQDIIIKQVIENLENAVVQKEKFEIKIFLKPENLGPVIVNIENKEKQIKVNIQVANNEVKDILKANIADLKNTVNNIGFDVNDLEVSMMNQNIGTGVNDFSNNSYKEWQGAAIINNDIKEIVNMGDIINADDFSYLNFLA